MNINDELVVVIVVATACGGWTGSETIEGTIIILFDWR